MKLNNLKIKEFEINILDHPNSISTYWIQKELNEGGYQLDSLDIKPEDTIIDVGSNTGIFAIYVNKKFGCRIIGFEPIKEIYDNAVMNLRINGISNVEIHNSAVTAKDGDVINICLDESNSGGSSLYKKGNLIECKTESLVKYIETENNLKMLKIDCEGGEYDIIPSIIEHLNKFDYLAIEYHKYNESQDPIALHNLIKQNFKGLLISNDPNNPVYW